MLDLTRHNALPLIPRRRALGLVSTLPLLGWPLASQAQFRVEVAGVGLTQFPFSAVGFRGNDAASENIAAIVRADLERSGQFRFVDPIAGGLDETSRPDLGPWRERGSDSLLTGSVTKLADGRFDVRFRLWDVVRGQDLGGLSYPVGAQDLRLAAHRVADFIYEKITGEKGVFSTRIAYVTKTAQRHNLWVADADGENARAALTSPEPIISPSWAPGGAQLAYVSFEARKPVIYAHDVASGKRRLLANFKGSNSAPSWSPDGRSVVATLSLSGNAQVYAMDANGGEPRRLSQSASIDTEPVFSPDGKTIYFVSDRGGSPQVYRMGAQGGNAQRLTFTGNYNISPAPSPDGRWLAFISRVNGAFRLHVMEVSSGNVTALTESNADESPSFSPNSRMIIYATRERGQEALMTTTVDGRIKTRLAGAQGDIREPEWGPFLR
ncbi:Tol-Pal system beta propeller repeat protein TolB [Hydrogenophaga sp.]|uniref:Tol-Pal system beta propeller repeat protein TolB n=1 Tax=Hydrogenophaga sp. TaxID=1904254 RepID=UPI002731AC63|nr:Tol-Pal system beta propeller repeat protein TolB [Hydrogenophaga sp.]MDP2017600.1 Tol-Pal system beta propeller repeat protein TolB [Hydrogenophaga sp.]MDP3167872.1 Tol-Pal system beta propeller repeat protein TolB [Hydrogenophaga sp.]